MKMTTEEVSHDNDDDGDNDDNDGGDDDDDDDDEDDDDDDDDGDNDDDVDSGDDDDVVDDDDDDVDDEDVIPKRSKSAPAPQKKTRKRSVIDEDDYEDNEEELDEEAPKKKASGALPFSCASLLMADPNQIGVWAKQLECEASLEALNKLLPKTQQFEENWSSIRLPKTNSYGNIDIRNGVSSSLVHLKDANARLLCDLLRIPSAAAFVGFDNSGGRYVPKLRGPDFFGFRMFQIQAFFHSFLFRCFDKEEGQVAL